MEGIITWSTIISHSQQKTVAFSTLTALLQQVWLNFGAKTARSLSIIWNGSVMMIVNGYHSGRQAGAPISELTLSFLNQMLADPSLRHINYFAKNKRGETFKAFTSAILGENNRIIGLFCINFYLNISLLSFMQSFYPQSHSDHENISETFVENTEELMLDALENAKKTVYANPTITSSNKNKEIIYLLAQKGIFNLKDSVVTIANHLGISKNTVYMHLRNQNKS